MQVLALITKLMKALAHKLLQSVGIDIKKHNPHNSAEIRRALILRNQHIQLVLDIGANVGAYGRSIRRYGYKGKIVSFEPSSETYECLAKTCVTDPQWDCHQMALGETPTQIELNIAGNSASSSILEMTDLHKTAAPSSAYTGTEMVEMDRLDTVREKNNWDTMATWLKIDVQGYEQQVLNGGIETLKQVKVIELELSLATLYKGQALYLEMIQNLKKLGFELYSTENVLTDPKSGQVSQLDGIFVRTA
jgi:FkbM family methyltransferase